MTMFDILAALAAGAELVPSDRARFKLNGRGRGIGRLQLDRLRTRGYLTPAFTITPLGRQVAAGRQRTTAARAVAHA
jgi:hypothetical protein